MTAITKETVKSMLLQCLHDRANSYVNGRLVRTKSESPDRTQSFIYYSIQKNHSGVE